MLQLHETQDGDITIVTLCGEMDTHTVPDFKSRIQRLLGEGRLRLVFDFSDLRYICSAGIAVLVTSTERIHSRGGRACLCGVSGQVGETFHILQLHKVSAILGIFSSSEEALKEMRRP